MTPRPTQDAATSRALPSGNFTPPAWASELEQAILEPARARLRQAKLELRAAADNEQAEFQRFQREYGARLVQEGQARAAGLPALQVVTEADAWQYACEVCRGEGQYGVPTEPGSQASAMRQCRACNGTGLIAGVVVMPPSYTGPQ